MKCYIGVWNNVIRLIFLNIFDISISLTIDFIRLIFEYTWYKYYFI